MTSPELTSPYPWFGGKRRVVDLVWPRFGNPSMYIEPFFGSGAMLLGAPDGWQKRLEIINDKDAYVTNFWRSVRYQPDKVVEYMHASPPDEVELTARHAWLRKQAESLRTLMEEDVEACNPEVAGYWVWGISLWIGGGFCASGSGGKIKGLPALAGKKGVHGEEWRTNARAKIDTLARRFSKVGITCGDWKRVVSHAFLAHGGAIFLDPPYEVSGDVYRVSEGSVGKEVVDFCIENGKNRQLRIAVCGYSETIEIPSDWEEVPWKASIGFASQSALSEKENKNRFRERIWFSPGCLRPTTTTFFDE